VRHFSQSSHYDDRPHSDITSVEVPRHGTLRITFADGLKGEVDVLSRMHGEYSSALGRWWGLWTYASMPSWEPYAGRGVPI
jgi:hypothetical protein